MILFEGDDIIATAVPAASHDLLVVTFGPRTPADTRKTAGFGQSILEKNGIFAVHFVPQKNHWWQTDEMDRAIEAVRRDISPAAFRRVVTYGSSMGGHGALLFAGRLSAEAALAFSPQFSMYDSGVPMHPVWRADMAAIDERFRIDAAALSGVRPYIVHDPFNAFDVAHAAAIRAVAPTEDIRLPFADHNTAGHMRDLGLLGETTLAILKGDFDVKAFAQKHRKARSQNLTYLSGLRRRTAKSRAASASIDARVAAILAQKIREADPALRSSASSQFIMARTMALTNETKPDEAVALAQDYARLFPDFSFAFLVLANTYFRVDRIDDAAAAVETARRLNRRDLRPRLLAARIALRLGDMAAAAAAVSVALTFALGAKREWLALASDIAGAKIAHELKMEVLARVRVLDPNNPRVAFIAGLIDAGRGAAEPPADARRAVP